ncbi:hypothetical protein LL067_15665 [Yersinia pseudotuberculosis]|uniref:hypothetical protein n=1 Tax=Yersinia TaxID=629 RepID=UPI0011A08E6B|nr:hypothetical protein [Yersinia aleksiciae]EKN4007416.1 hypothetical protein [Yersinia enterocolitica]
MNKQTSSQVTKTKILLSVASSTAIETGVSVQKVEQQLKQNLAQVKAVGLAPLIWQDIAHQLHHRAVVP